MKEETKGGLLQALRHTVILDYKKKSKPSRHMMDGITGSPKNVVFLWHIVNNFNKCLCIEAKREYFEDDEEDILL